MKRVLYSICIGSLALALTAWGQQANQTTTVKAKATKQGAVSAQTTTSAKTGAKTSGNMAATRVHRRANVSARTSSAATVERNRMRNTSANARIRARNDAMVNRQRERNIAMTERMKTKENANVRNKTNVQTKVDVHDTTRFRNVTRITSNGRTFDRAVFRDRNDRRFHLGFHDRIFFINTFSEVVLINGCSFFLDDGIFWPAFIIGENCVHPRNAVFIAVD
jgi:hypothetical protein